MLTVFGVEGVPSLTESHDAPRRFPVNVLVPQDWVARLEPEAARRGLAATFVGYGPGDGGALGAFCRNASLITVLCFTFHL